VFERYYRELLSFLSRKVPDHATAADLAQESYARVYEAQRTGSVVRDPRALLYRTARNLVTDHHRRTSVRAGDVAGSASGTDWGEEPAELDDFIGPETFEPDTILASGQGLAAMVETIDKLPPRCREAFVLYKFDGLSYAEVAERMGISVRTVEMQLRIAMDACWACLERTNGDRPTR
jgi:RNA polymerase sigma factor (sigma-70 family)